MKIKLENIVKVPISHEHPVGKQDIFCRACGLPVTTEDVKISFVCSECRHPVGESDKFCGICGGDLAGDIKKTEHYFTGAVEVSHFDSIKATIEDRKAKEKIARENKPDR
ncbi:MAG: zinc ribbon domain-containing protein [Dehalococcoidia bacterium]|jgi:hypothetical protein